MKFNHLFAIGIQIGSEQAHGARVGGNQAEHHVNDGRLASSIGTDKAGNFSRLDDERNLVERLEIAVGFRETLDRNQHRETVRRQSIRNKPFPDLFAAPSGRGTMVRER